MYRLVMTFGAIGLVGLFLGCGSGQQAGQLPTATPRIAGGAADPDEPKVLEVSFEKWVDRLEAMEGGLRENIDEYVGYRVSWTLNCMGSEILTTFDPDQPLSLKNWHQRYRLFTARLEPDADLGAVFASPYPYEVVALPEMGTTEIEVVRGTVLHIEATVWGFDGRSSIYLKDFVITPAGPPPAAEQSAGPTPADRKAEQAIAAAEPKLKRLKRVVVRGSYDQQHRLLLKAAELVEDLLERYGAVQRLGSPDWSVAAGYLKGHVLEIQAGILRAAPMPPPEADEEGMMKRIPEEDRARHLAELERRHGEIMEERARELDQRAVVEYRSAADLARTLGVTGEWADQIRARLGELAGD